MPDQDVVSGDFPTVKSPNPEEPAALDMAVKKAIEMNADLVISLMMNALMVAVLIAAPMLFFGLVVGLAVSIFQAVTQIQEMTLAFIPKIFAIVLSLALFFPWMLQIALTYSADLLNNINVYIGK